LKLDACLCVATHDRASWIKRALDTEQQVARLAKEKRRNDDQPILELCELECVKVVCNRKVKRFVMKPTMQPLSSIPEHVDLPCFESTISQPYLKISKVGDP
jgi:hypothetical protein